VLFAGTNGYQGRGGLPEYVQSVKVGIGKEDGMRLENLIPYQKALMDKIPHGHKIKDEHMGSVVAVLGLMEEGHEYLNSIGVKAWRANPQPREEQLEELTDMLFFYLELVILSGFSVDEVEIEYKRKHAVNMDRYKRAEQNDYGWDTRGQKEGL